MKVTGPAFLWHPATGTSSDGLSFAEAFSAVHSELEASASGNDIMAAHLEMMDDPMLLESVQGYIGDGLGERDALTAACTSICQLFADIDDEYLRARVDDVRDIFQRIERKMTGETASAAQDIPAGSILVAEELLPSDTAKIDFSRIAGIICRRGSSTSHVCIIAHSHSIPVQVGADISGISQGDPVTVDDPMVTQAGSASIAEKVHAAGRRIYVNSGSVDEVRRAIDAGADGIGLFRTEFLFMDHDSLPTEDEQFAIYKDAVLACKGKPITIRTLDIGGDKQLACLPQDHEDNPFLGLRGIRLCLARPQILQTQLRAIARTAEYGKVRIMLPMVSLPDEVVKVRDMMAGLPKVELGIMVETPAAIFGAAELAACSDFFSVGSNDLTQYIMAADRGNASVAYLYDSKSAPVLKALSIAVDAAHAAGIKVGICGELASDSGATDTLLGIGFDSLSISRL